MSVLGIKRAAAMALAGVALVGATLGAAGTASAATGGGCGGPGYEEACVSARSDGAINSDAYTN
jgi:hypothetical protein